MLTLAVDTTSEFGSIALVDESRVLEEVSMHETKGFSTLLFGQIEAMLDRCGVGLNQIELFAGASGPGSFTGVRVGLAAIKGLAEVQGKRAIAVSNLEALATFGMGAERAVVIDAHRGEIFGAVYDSKLHAVVPETVIRFPEFLTVLGDRNVEWICSDFSPFVDLVSMPVITAPKALATAIARIAIGRIQAGVPGEAAAIEANYVRRSDAEIFWKSI